MNGESYNARESVDLMSLKALHHQIFTTLILKFKAKSVER